MMADLQGGIALIKNRKTVIGFLILSILLALSGCKKEENPQYTINPDPPSVDITQTVPMDFEMETDYGNISVKTERNIYPKNTEKIVYTITNHNPGKGFYYFSLPYVEFYDGESWIRLAYYPPDYHQEAGVWNVCGVEGEPEMEFSTNGIFYPQSVTGGIQDGAYRLVIFVGDTWVSYQFRFEN